MISLSKFSSTVLFNHMYKDIHGHVLIHVLDCHLDWHLNQHLDRYSISFLINTWPTQIDIRFISILINTRSTLDWHSVNNWQSVNLLVLYILTYMYFFYSTYCCNASYYLSQFLLSFCSGTWHLPFIRLCEGNLTLSYFNLLALKQTQCPNKCDMSDPQFVSHSFTKLCKLN